MRESERRRRRTYRSERKGEVLVRTNERDGNNREGVIERVRVRMRNGKDFESVREGERVGTTERIRRTKRGMEGNYGKHFLKNNSNDRENEIKKRTFEIH